VELGNDIVFKDIEFKETRDELDMLKKEFEKIR
jgi:hypothetical protein